MYSQCPACQTRFRVTAAALRAARGTVRCGRCGSAFDALARLSDDLQPDPVAPHAASPEPEVAILLSSPEPESADEYHFSAEDIEKVFVDARDWQQQFGDEAAPTEATETAAVDAEPPVVVDVNDRVEDITLEGERIRIETVPEYEIGDLDGTDEVRHLANAPGHDLAEARDAATEPEIFVESLDDKLSGTAEAAAESPSAAPAAVAPQPWISRRETPESELLPGTVLETTHPAARNRLAWTGGSLALALLLLLQLVHHFRQDLARHPQIGAALRGLYGGLGLELSPNWDLGAFELKQWNNEQVAGTDGRMSVRASLRNRASFAQPHPVLRLELEDRYGEPVAVRDFEPAEYLKNPSQAARLIGPGGTSEAEILIVDPGPEAVGYRLDVCLRESDALLRCAQGQG